MTLKIEVHGLSEDEWGKPLSDFEETMLNLSEYGKTFDVEDFHIGVDSEEGIFGLEIFPNNAIDSWQEELIPDSYYSPAAEG